VASRSAPVRRLINVRTEFLATAAIYIAMAEWQSQRNIEGYRGTLPPHPGYVRQKWLLIPASRFSQPKLTLPITHPKPVNEIDKTGGGGTEFPNAGAAASVISASKRVIFIFPSSQKRLALLTRPRFYTSVQFHNNLEKVGGATDCYVLERAGHSAKPSEFTRLRGKPNVVFPTTQLKAISYTLKKGAPLFASNLILETKTGNKQRYGVVPADFEKVSSQLKPT
jgi:hypothetical protein